MPLIQPPSHSEGFVSVFFSVQCLKCFAPRLWFSQSSVLIHISHVQQYFESPIVWSSVALACFAFLLSAGFGSAAPLFLSIRGDYLQGLMQDLAQQHPFFLSIREDYLQGLMSQNGYGHLFRGHFPPSEGPRPRPHKFHFPWAQNNAIYRG